MSASARLLPVACLAGLCVNAPSHAQERPAIPEVACTRIHVIALPGTGPQRREIALRIVNDDPADFHALLRPEIEVESLMGGAWHHVSVAGLRIRSNCRYAAISCVTLAPRSSVTVVAWTGMVGDGQCICTRCAPAPAGTYRFVVHTCANCFSPTEAYSAPFTLPPSVSQHAS